MASLTCTVLENVAKEVKGQVYGIKCNPEKYILDAEAALTYDWLQNSLCDLSVALQCKIEDFCREEKFLNAGCTNAPQPTTCPASVLFNCNTLTVGDTGTGVCDLANPIGIAVIT